jgi:hydrogenase maturation protease
MTSPVASSVHAPQTARRASGRASPVAVEVLICGSVDRGDDGAPIAAAHGLRDRLDPDVRLRVIGQLDIDDLLGVPAGAGVVIVDAATGLRRGEIVELPLDGLVAREDDLRPRSSHSLEFREVIGLADMLRGRPLPGRIIAIGGGKFGLGAPLSPSVAKAIPALIGAILDAIGRLRG